jgi:DHA1 family tetracycline resistance protein-like MFS transporter
MGGQRHNSDHDGASPGSRGPRALAAFTETYVQVFARHPPLIAVAASTLFVALVFGNLNNIAIAQLLRESLHVHRYLVLVGQLVSTALFVEFLFKLPFGYLSDLLGRKRFIALAPMAGSIVPVLIALTPASKLWLLYPLFALNGLTVAAFWPVLYASVSDLADASWRPQALAVVSATYLCGTTAGYALGPVVSAATGDYRLPFLIGAALLFMAGMSGALWIPETHTGRRRRLGALADLAAMSGAVVDKPAAAAATAGPRVPLSLVIAITFALFFAVTVVAPFVESYSAITLGINVADMWPVVLAMAACIAVLALPLSRVSNIWSKANVVRTGLIMAAVAMGFVGRSRDVIMLFWAVLLAVAAFLLGLPAWLALVTRGVPPERRGTIMGIVTAAQGGGASVGPLVGGYLAHRDPHFPFFGSAAILGLAALLALVFLRDDEPSGHPAEAAA